MRRGLRLPDSDRPDRKRVARKPRPKPTTEQQAHAPDPRRLDPLNPHPAALMRLGGQVGNALVARRLKAPAGGERRGPAQKPAPLTQHGQPRVDRWNPFKSKSKGPKDAFLKKHFKLDLFTPSTGIGRFGLKYDPKSGDLEIIVRLRFVFTDADPGSKSLATNADETKWSTQKKKEWIADFKEQIASVWGNISEIQCTKPGFEDVVARPRIVIEETTSKSKSHYNVDVDKAFMAKNPWTGQEKLRTGAGSTSVGSEDDPKHASFQEQDVKDKIKDPAVRDHLANTERSENIGPAYERDRERLIERLATIGEIQFEPRREAIDLESGLMLDLAARKLLDLRKDSALAHLHPLDAKVKVAPGLAPGLEHRRAEQIRTGLEGRGVENEVKSKPEPADVSGAKLEASPESQEVKDAYFAQWTRVTVAHEFGHMLGLLDEYCPAVSPELLQMMVDEGKLMPGYVMTPFAQARVPQDSSKQDAYAKLLQEQGMETPTWARPTAGGQEKSTSLMSGGFEVLKQHYVTIAEGLAELTKGHVARNQWKIQ